MNHQEKEWERQRRKEREHKTVCTPVSVPIFLSSFGQCWNDICKFRLLRSIKCYAKPLFNIKWSKSDFKGGAKRRIKIQDYYWILSWKLVYNRRSWIWNSEELNDPLIFYRVYVFESWKLLNWLMSLRFHLLLKSFMNKNIKWKYRSKI